VSKREPAQKSFDMRHSCKGEKEKREKPDRKLHPLLYGLRNPYRNLESEKSQDYAQKPQQT
jgi:hypothetical protein